MWRFLIALCVLLALAPLGRAQEVELEEVVITAARLPEPRLEATASVLVINAVEIQKKEARLLPEVLRDVLGLHLVQNGAEGKQASVFLRGTNSDHTLVLIDGVRVNSTTTGGFDFSAISVDDIERIEVLKGPQSTLYGSDAIGGVINIITKRGRGKPRLGVSTEARRAPTRPRPPSAALRVRWATG